jgi:homoserine kinase
VRYHLRAPATSANLGPGFDALGLALGLYNDFFFEIAETTQITGCSDEHCGPDNLFLRSFRSACNYLNHPAPELRLDIKAFIPLARGLGSSAAMIVGGVGAAFMLYDSLGPGSRRRILDIAAEIEGHPDNVAPAIYGGFCASISKGDGHYAVAQCPVASDWRFHALIPPFELPTTLARAALPAVYPKADVVFNLGRAALLTLAVSQKNLDLFGAGCDDKIHQPYRKALIPGWEEVTKACRKAGAAALWLSGAGPTIMAVGTAKDAGAFEGEIKKALMRPEGTWRHEILASDPRGLRSAG